MHKPFLALNYWITQSFCRSSGSAPGGNPRPAKEWIKSVNSNTHSTERSCNTHARCAGKSNGKRARKPYRAAAAAFRSHQSSLPALAASTAPAEARRTLATAQREQDRGWNFRGKTKRSTRNTSFVISRTFFLSSGVLSNTATRRCTETAIRQQGRRPEAMRTPRIINTQHSKLNGHPSAEHEWTPNGR